ncbi:MAG: hypothetical protein OXH27_03755 [Gammaproteobacteria bacterium]|nr:hypothetical protein [Gammaproteobacteria bacterium]MCY3688191.1 hypothetical protein [Gammaproteobacteria bacterium]MDE0478667.1 hypothetical protein [Gammaproteobacteria bacterium]MYA37665.1 hypothetical protein [Gammaproteobacteria bacterium]MYH47580.1 hypothetical protein [Gammaproteobacteria bacterium]
MFSRLAIGIQTRVRLAFNTACLGALTLLAGCDPQDADVVESGAERVRTIGESASFRGINGILFGPGGDLYLTSVVTPAVARVDPESGEILDNWGLDDGAQSPDDLAFGPDGSVYWTDISHGDVSMRTPAGENRVIASPGVGVNPITFSDDGRLFVSQCFMDTNLFELDPAGEQEPRLIRDDLGPGCGLNGMDWGSVDGRLYGPRWFRGEVVSVDVDSGEIETVASGFGVPAAVKFNSEGVLHVLDSLRGEVVRIGESGSKEVVARVQPGLDNFAFDTDDRLFISSFADGFIVEALSPEENRVVLEGGLNMPGGLALIGTGDAARLVVADFFALRRLDPETGDVTGVVRDVIGFSEIGTSMSVHATDEGQLVLSSWFDNAVRLWDPATDSLVQIFGELAAPIDAVQFEGNIVVSQWGAGNVISFSPDNPEERRVLAEGLSGPAGLSVANGVLYVADNLAGALLRIGDSGAEPVAEGLDQPEGLAAANGSIYVVEAGAGRVVEIDPASGESTTVTEGLELQVPPSGAFPNTMLFNGIATDGETAWVAGDAANTVYVIDLD